MSELPSDVRLSSGRTVKHSRMANGAIDAYVEGGLEMTPDENDEYMLLRGLPLNPRIEVADNDIARFYCKPGNDKR